MRLTRPMRPSVYAIANCDDIATKQLVARISASLRGGAAIVQLRAKKTPPAVLTALAREVKYECDHHGALLIINDYPQVAHDSGAHGVHIGREDVDCKKIRSDYGDALIVGVSCYAAGARAEQAIAGGADYVAFGSVYASPTKPDAPRCGLNVIEAARAEYDLPIVAIGGITPANAGRIVEAGADYVAVISGIFDQEDIETATRQYVTAINPPLVQ